MRPRPALSPLLALPLALACGRGGHEPAWVDLTQDFRPQPLGQVAGRWTARDPGASSRPHHATDDASAPGASLSPLDEVWIEATLTPADWTAGEVAGRWSAPRPRDGAFAYRPDGRTRLAAGDLEFRRVLEGTPPEAGDYLVEEQRLHLALAPDAPLPAKVVYGVRVGNGRPDEGRWRVSDGSRVAAGIPVWTGEREVLTRDVPADCALSVVVRWSGPRDGERPTLRVLLDGEEKLAVRPDVVERHHRVPFSKRAREGARIAFEADGPPGLALFLVPRLVPAEVGDFRARPWGDDRPDVVLFLADTFRADLMAIHGGEPGATPRLDAFSDGALRFLEARATSSWTLPSISSMLTGLHPGQHAAVDQSHTLPEAHTTLAERFRASGYRTGAITDSAFFSHGYGLDQGFDWFCEYTYPDWDLTRTVDDALAFLGRDDGRPVFLVVHSYRVHAPYRTGPDEDLAGWEDLMADGFALLEDQAGGRGTRQRVLLRLADRARELYVEGARDLDAEFGRLLDALSARGLLESGYLAVTSDHGEAFGENGQMMHGKDLYDVKLRVPLLVAGRDLAPGDVTHPVSLVDLAPTLTGLAGVAPAEGWSGTSLLTSDEQRTTYAFLLEDARKQLAIVDGDRKVLSLPTVEALAAGRALHAFDLARDPAEESDLAGAAEWVEGLLREQAEAVAPLLVPRAEPGRLGPGAENRPDLRQIGYGG